MGPNLTKVAQLAEKGIIPASTLAKVAMFKKELEKNAYREEIKKMLALAGASAAVGAGSFLAQEGAEKYFDYKASKQMPKIFNNMLEAHPELQEEDPIILQRYFNSLANVAPDVARDPLAAGAFIKQSIRMSELGGPPVATYQTLAQTQKDIAAGRAAKAGKGNRFGAKVLSPSFNVISEGVEEIFNPTPPPTP